MPYLSPEDAAYPTLADRHPVYKNFPVRFDFDNPWEMPIIQPYKGPIPEKMIRYSSLGEVPESGDLSETAVHFFEHDEKFESVWTRPAVAMNRIRRAMCALMPDFSLYEDFPLPIQYYNKYRQNWCAALWQAEGIPVIPKMSWAGIRSMSWCLAGLPKESTVAVGAMGAVRDKEERKNFLLCYEAALERLNPKIVLFYGNVPKDLPRSGYTLYTYETMWAALHKRGKGESHGQWSSSNRVG